MMECAVSLNRVTAKLQSILRLNEVTKGSQSAALNSKQVRGVENSSA